MKLYPVPSKMTTTGKFADFSAKRWIILPSGADFPLKKRTMEMASAFRKISQGIRVSCGIPSAGDALAILTRKEAVPAEGYTIEIAAKGPACISASTDSGFFYALQTLFQLIAEPGKVPCCTIKDEPSLKSRGYMLDVSRCKVPTMETMRGLVRSLAKLRCNSLQLYMEHTFEFAGHERVWDQASPFSPEEIMELDAYCKDYFIELVPNLNSFGHFERWLKFDEYQDLAECKRPVWQSVLAPDQKSIDFVASLYDEMLPNFTARKLNVGCDETWELGKGKSAARCKKTSVTRVYLEHLKKIAAQAGKRGFGIEFWGDIIMHEPELIPELPKGITALEWGYEANHPFAKDTLLFKKSGIPFLVCPGTSAWLTLIGRTDNMLKNIQNAVSNGTKNGAEGILQTDWGDGGHHQYFPVSWPGISMALGSAWNAKAPETVELLPYAISMAFAGNNDEGERLGAFLLEMGHVIDHYRNPRPNSTPYGFTLVIYPPREMMEQLKKDEAKAAVKHVQQLIDAVTAEPFTDPLVHAEILNGLEMALAMNQFLVRALGGDWKKDKWLDLMRHVTARHEQLWLSRNRPGGLAESIGVLKRAMDYDPDAWKNQKTEKK